MTRLGCWWRWVTATRARRSAFTLAVLAAMAAPFVADSYYDEYVSFYASRFIPLTAKDRAEIFAELGEDTNINNCFEHVDSLTALRRHSEAIELAPLRGELNAKEASRPPHQWYPSFVRRT
jgi:hypothetical protein